MIIYPQETMDGIAELVKASTSVAYHIPAKPLQVIDERGKDRIHRSLAAANKDQPDLFYLDTILVTTGWNINKDIFDRKETWAARHTAEDKPFNLGHVQTDIIGHITDNFVVGESYKLVPDNSSLDDVPDKFHILTGAVIYKFWEDKDRMKTIATLIDEINTAAKWFVSMECLFSDFDYGLISSKGENKVIPRNEDSAFLTKHLVQYKGSGKYQDYSIGRVLKNITFSGKGLVETPANPESKILTDVRTFANLGYINLTSVPTEKKVNGDDIMSELETQLKVTVASLEKEKAELQQKVLDSGTKASAEKISDLTSKLEAADKKTKSDDEDKDKLEKKTKDMATELATLAEAKKKVEDELKVLAETVEATKREQVVKDREAKAVKAGASDEEAKAFAKANEVLSEEAYASMVEYASYKWKAATPTTTTTAPNPAAATTKVLETAQKPAGELTVASTEGQMETTILEAAEYVRASLNKHKKEK